MIRILLVGEIWPARQDTVALLAAQADLQLVGKLPFADEMPIRAAELWPRVVVFNTEYMVSRVVPAVVELKARIPGCSALMLADPRKRGMLPPRRRSGGLSFLTRDSGDCLLLDTIREVASGKRVICARLQLASLGSDKQVNTRELEVLDLAAEGKRATEIAERLYLSGGTVRNYLSAAIAKTGARNLLDAIRILREGGWLQ